jgi:hypothetical protein
MEMACFPFCLLQLCSGASFSKGKERKGTHQDQKKSSPRVHEPSYPRDIAPLCNVIKPPIVLAQVLVQTFFQIANNIAPFMSAPTLTNKQQVKLNGVPAEKLQVCIAKGKNCYLVQLRHEDLITNLLVFKRSQAEHSVQWIRVSWSLRFGIILIIQWLKWRSIRWIDI